MNIQTLQKAGARIAKTPQSDWYYHINQLSFFKPSKYGEIMELTDWERPLQERCDRTGLCIHSATPKVAAMEGMLAMVASFTK